MSSHQLVNEMISKSSNKKILDEVFSDHFDNLINPVSVSLGLSLKDKNVKEMNNETISLYIQTKHSFE